MKTSLGGLLAVTVLSLAACPGVVLAQKNAGKPPEAAESIIGNLLQEHDNIFVLYPYENNYIIYTVASDMNKEAIKNYNWADHTRNDEVKFQLSLGFPLWRGILGDNSLLGASYTQRSWWQLSNQGESSPFRETNYEPQLFLGFATDYQLAGWTLRDVEMGYNHESNGRADPTSRSWNRIYTRLMADHGNWLVEVKPWYVVGDLSDNPDINRYLGYYRLTIGYRVGESIFSARGQYNWNSGYGGAELGFSYPVTNHVRFYTQVWTGYGESLIDYNFNQTRVGVGVTLNDLF